MTEALRRMDEEKETAAIAAFPLLRSVCESLKVVRPKEPA